MGRSRGGLTSKIHALVDTNGLPIRLALTAGEAQDNRLAGKLLSRLKSGTMLLADRGMTLTGSEPLPPLLPRRDSPLGPQRPEHPLRHKEPWGSARSARLVTHGNILNLACKIEARRASWASSVREPR
jgi:hypothetical protein